MILRRHSFSSVLRICAALVFISLALNVYGNFFEGVAYAAGSGEGGHASIVTPVLLSLVIILLVAKIGGDIAIRLNQPEVLGELIMGVILGNLSLFGISYFEYISHDAPLEMLSELGVIILLFEVGLETSVKEMMQIGLSALLVAILGVVAPFFLGWVVAAYFVPEANTLVHVFVGATLTATSVGITARVLKDLNKINDEHHLFDAIYSVDPPRYIMQYKAKTKSVYIDKYLNALNEIAPKK